MFTTKIEEMTLQEVLPITSPCPLNNSDQNGSVVPFSSPNSPEVASPPLITDQHRTRQIESLVPEASPRDPRSSTSPTHMETPQYSLQQQKAKFPFQPPKVGP